MNRKDISNTLGSLPPELGQIVDKTEKAAMSKMLNLVETLATQVDELKKENQSLELFF